MRKQMFKTFGLGLLLATAVSSCGGKDDKNSQPGQKSSKAQTESKQQKAQCDERAERNRIYEYEKHVRDSIIRANGFPEGSDSLWRAANALDDSIRTLEYKNSPMYAMKNEVFTAGNKIAETYTEILESKLKIYGLSFDKETVQDVLSNDEFIMYGAYKDAGEPNTEFEWFSDWAVESIVKSLNLEKTSYGESRQQEIVKTVKETTLEMCNEMYPRRKSIERKHAKHFAGGMNAVNAGCVEYSEGGCYVGYCDWELNNSALVTEKKLWLYDSKLPVDFFADQNAEYNVETLGGGKWRIAKKTKDGKVSKTEIFVHDTDYEIATTPVWLGENVPNIGSKSFYATPGDNIGMHINYSEVIAVTKPEVKFTGSAELERQIRELKHEREKVDARYDEFNRVLSYADSVARQMSQAWATQGKTK